MQDKLSEIIKASMTAHDPSWDKFVKTVDHKRVGELARAYRISKKVRAVDIGRRLGISKVRVYFLERGRTAWNLATLTKYLQAVKDEGGKNELRKVQSAPAASKKTNPKRKKR